MTRVKISLIGADGLLHAEGIVDLAKLLDAHLIERNKRLYYFKPNVRIGNYIFEECSQPYVLTEF